MHELKPCHCWDNCILSKRRNTNIKH